MAQSTLKNYFLSTGEKAAKRTKQLKISDFTVPVDEISDDALDEEVTITYTVGCPPPAPKKGKRPVGRPKKPVDLDLEEFHDLNDLQRESFRYDKLLYDFYIQDLPLAPSTKTRFRFSVKKKESIIKSYKELGSYAAASREFGINEATVRNIVKQLKADRNKEGKVVGGASFSGNMKGGGRPLSYPKSVEESLLEWIFVMNDNHLPVSSRMLSKKAKELIAPHNPSFTASRGWIDKFMCRNKLSLRKRTSMSQKLPKQLESKITSFYSQCAKAIRIGKYPLELIGNMDETPMWFDIVPQSSITKKGSKSVVIRTSGSDKRHLTVVLAVMADGTILPPMIIFKGKTNRTIRDLVVPTGFVVTTQEKAWMDEERMLMWLREIWIKYTEKKQEELEFSRSFLTLDSFSAHKVDSVLEEMATNDVGSLEVPGGCTSKVQVLDVSVNRPFKLVLGECWEDYVLGVVEKLGSDNLLDPNFKLTAPSRQLIVDWVLEGYNYLLLKRDMIKKGFEVCGITSTDPERVRNDSFYKDIMRNVQEEMKAYECELVDNDPFEFDECIDLDI